MARARRGARLTALPDDADERGAALLDSARQFGLMEAFLLEELIAEQGLTVRLGERGRLVVTLSGRRQPDVDQAA